MVAIPKGGFSVSVVTSLILTLVMLSGAAGCSKEEVPAEDPLPSLPWITQEVVAQNVQRVVFYSPAVGDSVSFHLFLPDGYHTDTAKAFPVIYWLHGGGGSEGGIPILVDHFSNGMADGKIPEVIVVFPNGLPLGMWCNSKDGKQPVEDMFIQDLIPYVDHEYRTIASRRGRVVEGFSMGGYGAARFGFKYHHLFGGFSLFAAGPLQPDFSVVAPQNQNIQPKIFNDVYGNDMDYFYAVSPWHLAETYGHLLPDPTPKRIIVGKDDFVYPNNVLYHQHLDSLGIPHQYSAFNQIGHNAEALLFALNDQLWVLYNSVFE
jgi:enterochelin esterase-like enzyme